MAQVDRLRREFDSNESEINRFVDVLYLAGNQIRFERNYFILLINKNQ